MHYLYCWVLFIVHCKFTLQDCPEEISKNGIHVKWRQTGEAIDVESDPVCYHNRSIVTRNCTKDEWTPPVDNLRPCYRAKQKFNVTSCPPGFYKISEADEEYCFQIGPYSNWNLPCFGNGGASVITDLNEEQVRSLIESLHTINISSFYWLPAQRSKMFNPLVWFVPGPNWGQVIQTNNTFLRYLNLFWKNCLALDIDQKMLVTKTCSQSLPSLCLFENNISYSRVCSEPYTSFRYNSDNNACYGIEHVSTGLTYNEFIETKCDTPMTNDIHELNRYLFTKIASAHRLPGDTWCWFGTAYSSFTETDYNNSNPQQELNLKSSINNVGTLALFDSSTKLSCMACVKSAVYGKTEFMFEYNDVENTIYLTIYFPSGLWKYDNEDKGFQCFSDATGFVGVVEINSSPYMYIERDEVEGSQYIEKIIYIIDLVTDRSAQYWCEGHTTNFSLVTTEKIVVNPKGGEVHVFALVANYYVETNNSLDISEIKKDINRLTAALDVYNILVMDIFNITETYMQVLLHVHTPVICIYDDESSNVVETYNDLIDKIEKHFPSFNMTFVNLTSSLYCLPSVTNNTYIELDWELTSIGHISAPKQFCLQSNGLPVRRRCYGSYQRGSKWGEVEGSCDTNYSPSNTTTFLYSIIKGQVPKPYTSTFLTDGLGFVLQDVKSIIPADIYYLSLSLKEILSIAHENSTSVEIGDIDNIAWVMDRVMELDWEYLRLAQTLNSTNVIINSVNDVIELIAKQKVNSTNPRSHKNIRKRKDTYQLAVQPQFVVQISYPAFNNITGIAISKTFQTNKFDEMIIQPLYANTSFDEVFSIKDLEVATWIPTRLLNTIEPNVNDTGEEMSNNSLHIIINVFKNDAVFQELSRSSHRTNSRIVSVSIPGYKSDFMYPLPLIFNKLKETKSEELCGFWDFHTRLISQTSGFWKTEGCFPKKLTMYNITICECFHLTHFSQLIKIPPHYATDDYRNQKQHARALDVITLVGSFLSLIGIVGIWITAMVFTNWRRKPGTKVLLQLSTSIAMPLVFIIIMNFDNSIFVLENDVYSVAEDKKPFCVFIGASLHYSILASFMWMLIAAVLQFIRYVRVLGVSRPSRCIVKFALIGWGTPLLPVIIVLAIDIGNYIPVSASYRSICYPQGFYFIVALMVPICIVLLVNVILFILVLHAISKGPKENSMKAVDMDLVFAQLRLSIFLVFLLGLTWIFGIFSFTKSLLWSYLFCLTATLQGFVLFIYFIICDPATRNMWISLVKPPFTGSSSSLGSSRSSISTIAS